MDNTQPLVSIITITLGRPDLIHRCIESIQRQTYSNYEHIIVDASSGDETEKAVMKYSDSHIKYLRSPKGPQVQTRIGVDHSSGAFITMLDDDDEYEPTKLEKQLKLIETLPEAYGLVYCWMTYYDNTTKEQLRIHKTELRGFVGDLAVERPLISGTPTMFYRRGVFEEFGGTFDDSHGVVMSDWELLCRITQKYKVDFVPESLVRVYINHGHEQLSFPKDPKRLYNQIKFHNYFLEHFANVFQEHPKRQWYHLSVLSRNSFLLKNYSAAWGYYRRLIKIKRDIRSLMIPITSLFA